MVAMTQGAAGPAVRWRVPGDWNAFFGLFTNVVLNAIVLTGLILGAIAAFIIDRKFRWAAFYAAAGAVLSFFGFIHGTQLGIAASPGVALGYVMIAAVCLLFAAQRPAPA